MREIRRKEGGGKMSDRESGDEQAAQNRGSGRRLSRG